MDYNCTSIVMLNDVDPAQVVHTPTLTRTRRFKSDIYRLTHPLTEHRQRYTQSFRYMNTFIHTLKYRHTLRHTHAKSLSSCDRRL